MLQRYQMRQEDNGLWSVIDLATEHPVVLDGVTMDRLEMDEADEALEMLQALAWRAKLANENDKRKR